MSIGRVEDNNYRDLAIRLLPPGSFWSALAAPGMIFHSWLYGIGAEFSRVHNRIFDAKAELDPRTATETIASWEKMLGLPTPCESDLAARRGSTHAKLLSTGGNNPARFTQLAAALGVDVNIYCPYAPARVNESHAEDLCEDISAKFIWKVASTNLITLSVARTLTALYAQVTPAHIVIDYDLKK